MNEALLQGGITIVLGALAGGLTNTVAIWMLFHPYEPPRLLGRRIGWLQGAVPKNQERLAAAIGRTVGTRLLTPEDLERTFAEPEFRAAFDDRLAAFLDGVLHQERGSLQSLLPPALVPEIESLLERMLTHGVERLESYFADEAFERMLVERTDPLVEAVRDTSISGVLTPAREAALGETLDEWLTRSVARPGFREALDTYLKRAAERLLQPERTFEEVLPAGLVGALERAIAGYLPLAIQRLGGLLDDPEARARFEVMLRALFERLLGDLRFHQRLVARLVMNEDTLNRVLDTIQDEGAERISEMLRDPAIQEAMARGVNEAIVDFLQRPVRSVLGDPDSDSVVDARETLLDGLISIASDADTRRFVVDRLHEALERAGARTWGDVLERVPRDELAGWIGQAVRSDTASELYRKLARTLAREALHRPIGTPARWLPGDGAQRIEAGIGPTLWSWLQTQVPDVVERLDVARRVEHKVIAFPTAQMEDMVRRVTERELRLIVRLGYVLGAFIGLVLVGVDRWFG
jgi:uncharacterized membrane protein YheB (UPF0754 family)